MFHVKAFQQYSSRAHLSSVFFVSLIFFSSTLPSGASITNFGQWRNLNSTSKTVYITGVLDTFVDPLNQPSEHETFVANFKSCLKALNITAVDVVHMIDNFYFFEENWSFSPQRVIINQLIDGHCFHFLN